MRRKKRNVLLLTFLTFLSLTPIFLLYTNTPTKHAPWLAPPNPCDQFPNDLLQNYPLCDEKMRWLRNSWRSHQCYAQNGVNGSSCSFRNYLSTIEHHCPPMHPTNQSSRPHTNLTNLLTRLPAQYTYMRERIARLWPQWVQGAEEAWRQYPNTLSERRAPKIVLVFAGFLANERIVKFLEKSGKGGPLGELLQWSDLIASLWIAGHDVRVVSTKSEFEKIILDSEKNPCRNLFDIIFTDIMGLNIFRKYRNFLYANRCRIRLLDSFGTQAEFSSRHYFTKHMVQLSGSKPHNPWGGHALNLRQHWTFYPHSDDNTFLGFVVANDSIGEGGWRVAASPPKALIYGKEKYMWHGAESTIRVLRELGVEVHATVADGELDGELFEGVVNHGLLNASQISELLQRVHFFVGLGFPLEGPAPLEAIAHGAVFINPRFDKPKSRLNYPFLAEKPTLREFTSQCPFAEEIGEPHVITVDIKDAAALRDAIRNSLKLRPPRDFIPAEFTPRSMVTRVANLVETQQFCSGEEMKRGTLRVHASRPPESCQATCRRHALLCAPEMFGAVNRHEMLVAHLGCNVEDIVEYATPAAPHACVLQATPALFSCATASKHVRLCPCRDFAGDNRIFCKNGCLV